MTIDIKDAIKRLADCAGCTENELVHSHRVIPVTLRHQLWKALYDDGMHPKDIANAFEHDRTTVLYGIQRANLINAKNGYKREHALFLRAMNMEQSPQNQNQ